jgi:F0F1-type ATP synthase assembly protein I
MARKPDNTRATISFVFVILLGLAIGFIIKKVHIGLIIGLVIGLFASGFMRRR